MKSLRCSCRFALSIKILLPLLIAIPLLTGCGAKEKSSNKDDEIELLKQRIEQHYKDGNYALAQQEIEELLSLSSTRSQRNIDEKIEKEFMELLEKIHKKMREEERAEEDDRDREVPAEETEQPNQ